MTTKIHGAQVVLCCSLLFDVVCLLSALKLPNRLQPAKDYTLRFPMSFPVGGTINPMAGICTDAVDLVLSHVNSQREILPDFNVVADIIDDECRPNVGGPRVLEEFENWASNGSIFGNTTWKTRLPHDPEIWSKDVFTPPMFIGAICSGVCQAIARLPQHYNLVELATTCINPILDDKKRYPNFYRLFRSSKVYGLTRVNLIENLGFTKVAILSSTVQFGYHDSVQFMETLSQHGIETVAEEFYQTDPTAAVDRLMSSDVRVIFSNCYTNICPRVACAAYKKKYYGPTLVWIFNSEVLFLNKGKAGTDCEPDQLAEFAEGALFLGMDMSTASYPEAKSLFGLTGRDLSAYLTKTAPKAMKTRAVVWRILCFDIVENGIAIMDDLDRKLKRSGSSLLKKLKLRSNSPELMEEIRQAILSVNIPTMWGQKLFLGNITYGAINLPLAHSGPGMVVQQVQESKMRTVLVENISIGIGQLLPTPLGHFVWKTADGGPPKSEAILETIQLKIPFPAIVAFRILAAAAMVALIIAILSLLHLRKFPLYENSMTWINVVISCGPVFSLVALVLYPTGKSGELVGFNEFCPSAFFLLVLGCTLTLGGLVAKLAIPFFSNKSGPIGTFPKTQKNAALFLLLWCGINILLLIIFTSRHDSRISVGIVSHSPASKLLSPKTVTYTWEICHSAEFIMGWASAGFQVVYGAAGMMISMLMRGDSLRVYISDLGMSKICLYLAFPMAVCILLVKITLNSHAALYSVLAIHAFIQATIVVVTLTVVKLVRWGKHPAVDEELVRAQTAAKKKASRRPLAANTPSQSQRNPNDSLKKASSQQNAA